MRDLAERGDPADEIDEEATRFGGLDRLVLLPGRGIASAVLGEEGTRRSWRRCDSQHAARGRDEADLT